MFTVQTNAELADSGWTTVFTFKTKAAAEKAYRRLVKKEPFYAVRVLDRHGNRLMYFAGR